MRAVEYYTNDDIRVVDVPVPEIGAGEILVHLQACGVCGSDVMEWYMRPRAPLHPGHEPVGIVAAVGTGVQQFAPGDRVFLHHHVPCMACHFCQRGSYSQCPTFRATRLYPGGLAEYIRVPAPNVQLDVLHLPDDLSFADATLIEPLGCCIRGLDRMHIQLGDSLCILGAGINGLMLALLAQQRGVSRVIIVDPIEYRRQKALEVGIDVVLDPNQAPLLEQILAANQNRKPDNVIVTPSKIKAMEQGLELVNPGGTVLFFAPSAPKELLSVEPHYLFFKEVTICTTYSAGPYDTRQALDLLRYGRIRGQDLITHRFKLEDAAQAFYMVAHPGDALKVIVTNEK